MYYNIIADTYFEKYNKLKSILIELLIVHHYILKQDFSSLINEFKLSINNTCNELIKHIELILNYIENNESESSEKFNEQIKDLIDNDLLNIENKYNYIKKYLTIFNNLININNIIKFDDNIINTYINTDIENITIFITHELFVLIPINIVNIYTKINTIYISIKSEYEILFTDIKIKYELFIDIDIDKTIITCKENIEKIYLQFKKFDIYLIYFKKLFYIMYVCMKTKIILTNQGKYSTILDNNNINLTKVCTYINLLNINIDTDNDLTYINATRDDIDILEKITYL